MFSGLTFDSFAELIGNMLDVIHRIRLIVIFFLQNNTNIRCKTSHVNVQQLGSSAERHKQVRCDVIEFTHQKIEDAETEHLEREAHVSVVVEPVEHAHTQTTKTNNNNVNKRTC